MPEISGNIGQIALTVSDVDTALGFYREYLRLAVFISTLTAAGVFTGQRYQADAQHAAGRWCSGR